MPIKYVFMAILFAMIEAHFIEQPEIFHMIIFWFPFVPLIALIISGPKSSLVWLAALIFTSIFNSYYLLKEVGRSYTIELFNFPILASGIIFTIAISLNSYILYYQLAKAYSTTDAKNRELEEIKEETNRKRFLLESYIRVFLNFSKNEANFNQGTMHLYEQICLVTSKTLKVNRVSIWMFDEKKDVLIRKFLCLEGSGSDEIIRLERKDYPQYFESLTNNSFIMASNAREHRDTKEFTESYLEPLNIHSMLDCPITVNLDPVGVICCENQGDIIHWNLEDTLFLQSFADFISMNYKNERIEELMQALKLSNKELKEKNKEIEVMNAALDSTVQKRTKALKTQNAQISEYSFINSHLLRAPLTRILGISNHLAEEAETSKETELFKALIESTSELDLVIRQINDVLYNGNGLTREDLEVIQKDIESKKNKA